MKIGIMQPYLFPYIGYWQLMNAVDRYVIFDDVNFINRGWINRNRILVNGAPKYFNVQMSGASQNKRILDVGVTNDPAEAGKQLAMIENAYRKAPAFADCFPLVADCFRYKGKNLADFVAHSIRGTADYLGIETELLLSSEIEKDETKRGQEKILDLCKRLGATEYYNAIGGRELYDQAAFSAAGIGLSFVQAGEARYEQFSGAPFVPYLSIIDVMMFCDRAQIARLLNDFTLVK